MRFEDDTYIAMAALAREFWRYKNWIRFEVEGQTGKYFGNEHQWQFNGLIIGRWHRFPWDEYLDTSFAVGDGLSYNTETSKVEKEDDEDAGKWLNYLMFELTLRLPKYPRWDFVYRIHHRSSIRGRIGNGALADLEAAFAEKHGKQKSGFLLLDNNAGSLHQRLMLIDEARYSLDIQYYLWYGDDSGELFFKRAMDAAGCGVRVRLITDEVLLAFEDETIAVIDAHPNVELRLFNPWRQHSSQRGVKAAQTIERFNYRMHNKLIVADNRIAILGGRNLGNEYFGLNSTFNFLDIDVLGVGPVARESSELFDHFWDNPAVVSASAFGHDQPEESPEEMSSAGLERLKKSVRSI